MAQHFCLSNRACAGQFVGAVTSRHGGIATAGRVVGDPCGSVRGPARCRLDAVHRASGDAVQEGAPGGAVTGGTVNKAMGLLQGWTTVRALPPSPSSTGKQEGLRTVLTTPAQAPRCERQRTITGCCRSCGARERPYELHFRSSGVPPRGTEAADRDRLRRSGREAPDARVVTDRFTRGHRVCRCRSGQALEPGDSNDVDRRPREVRKRASGPPEAVSVLVKDCRP